MVENHPNEDEYPMAYSMWQLKNKLYSHEMSMRKAHPNEDDYHAYSMWQLKNKLYSHE